MPLDHMTHQPLKAGQVVQAYVEAFVQLVIHRDHRCSNRYRFIAQSQQQLPVQNRLPHEDQCLQILHRNILKNRCLTIGMRCREIHLGKAAKHHNLITICSGALIYGMCQTGHFMILKL